MIMNNFFFKKILVKTIIIKKQMEKISMSNKK